MRNIFTLVILILLSVNSMADNSRPVGMNCALESPPPNSGETYSHGVIFLIFPRARDIDSNYTGCQSEWMPNGESWTLVSMVFIKSGDPIRIWSPSEEFSDFMKCEYKNGEVVKGETGKCPIGRFLIQRSVAHGCTNIIIKAVAEHGLGAPRPDECKDE